MDATKLLALGATACLFLPAVTSAHPRQEPAAKPAAEKKICKMIVPIGSTLGKRFCLTKAEWKELSERTQEDAAVALSRRGAGMCDIKC